MGDELVSVLAVRSSDGVEVVVSEEAAQQSALLRVYFENADGTPGTCLHLDNIDGRTLALVCKFMRYYAKSPYAPIHHPIQTSDLHDLFQSDVWYARFGMSQTFEDAVNIALAADFLGLDALVKLEGIVVAANLYGKDNDAIRKYIVGTNE